MTLTRRRTLGLLGASALAPASGFASPRLAYALVPIEIGDGVWMVEGSTDYFSMQNGGAIVNVTLLRGDSGLIVVDSGPSLRYGEALKTMALGLDIRGVSAVVNTHHHPDHFFGNQVFRDVPIHALGATQAAAFADGEAFADNMYRLLGDWMRGTEVVPPTAVVAGGDLVIDGRMFAALPLSGHTAADLALVDRATGNLIAGDLVFFNRAPTTPSADLDAWRASLDVLADTEASAIVPGHGPYDTVGASVAQTRAYLDWLEATLRQGARDGLGMVELMDLDPPAEFAGMGAMPQEFHRTVAHLYPGIETEILPLGN
ncbi:MAG: quinoprotein relay system zinc metallohydrolase 1 [Rhodobacter sp.]|nr:quinoprotein relay system zinc metallohydrolase 1 [Rhodobacter sp.]